MSMSDEFTKVCREAALENARVLLTGDWETIYGFKHLVGSDTQVVIGITPNMSDEEFDTLQSGFRDSDDWHIAIAIRPYLTPASTLEGALIVITGQEGFERKRALDLRGNTILRQIPPGIYQITIESEAD